MGNRQIVLAYTCVTLLLCFLRLFLGVDFTDEAQYAAQAYTPVLGVKPFEADLLIQQTAGLLIYPLVKAYTSLFGTEAFLLFLRFLYFALGLITTAVSFLFLRKYYHPYLAWISSTLLLIYIPGSLPSWSYNSISILCFPLSLMLLFGWGSGAALIGGLVAAVVCFCYPTLAAVYLLVVIYSWAKIFSGKWKQSANHLSFLLAALVGGSVSLVFMFGYVGFEKITELFTFSRSFGELGGSEKFIHFAERFWDGFQRTLYVLIFPALWVLRWKKGSEWFERHLPKILFVGLVSAHFSRMAQQRSMGWMIFISLYLFVLLLPRLKKFRQGQDPRWLFLLSGGFAAFIYAYSSGNGFMVACFGLLLAVQILTLEAAKICAPSEKNLRPAIIFLCAIGIYFTFCNYQVIYRDGPITQMSKVMARGPHKYLLTTPDRQRLVDTIQDEIVELSKSYKTLFAAYFTPAYLYTTMYPVTGMLYAHEEHWADLQLEMIMYRSLKHDEWPEIVFSKVSDDPKFVYQFEERFLASGRYVSLINKPEYRVLKRKDLN